jgi:hypothetical protein
MNRSLRLIPASVLSALAVLVGVTVLGGLAWALCVFVGIGVVLFALVRAFRTDYRREPPVPPGTHGPPTSGF